MLTELAYVVFFVLMSLVKTRPKGLKTLSFDNCATYGVCGAQRITVKYTSRHHFCYGGLDVMLVIGGLLSCHLAIPDVIYAMLTYLE